VPCIGIAEPERVQQPRIRAADAGEAAQDYLGHDMLAGHMAHLTPAEPALVSGARCWPTSGPGLRCAPAHDRRTRPAEPLVFAMREPTARAREWARMASEAAAWPRLPRGWVAGAHRGQSGSGRDGGVGVAADHVVTAAQTEAASRGGTGSPVAACRRAVSS